MQKRILLIICVLFNVLAFAGDNTTATSTLKLKTVVIDAGHGGHDPGALGKMSQEKNITLAVALKLGELIKKNIPEVKVIYTRSTDVFVELRNRADIANKNDADLFISIHVNSNPNSNASGVDTWVMGQYKTNENFQVAKEENKVILAESNYGSQYEGFDPNSTESYIIFNLMQNAFIGQSLEFASGIQNQVGAQGRKDRGVESAPFLVLWKTTMPSVLVETGFISNTNDEKLLVTDDGQNQMANIIFSAFKEYKIKVDSRTKLTVFDQPEESITTATTPTTNKDPFKTEPPNNKTNEGTKETAKQANLTASIDNHQTKEQSKTTVKESDTQTSKSNTSISKEPTKEQTKTVAVENSNNQPKTISKEFPKVDATKEQKATIIKQDVKPTIATTTTKEQTKVVNTSTQKTTEQAKPIAKESTKTETVQQTNNTSTTKEQKVTTIKQDVKPTIATTSTKQQTKVVNTSTQKTTEQAKPITKETPKTETVQQTNNTSTTKEQKVTTIKQDVKPTIATATTKEQTKVVNTSSQKTTEQGKSIAKESTKTETVQQTNNTSTTTKEQKATTIKQDVKPTIASATTKEQTKVVNTSTQKTTEQAKPITKETPKTETYQQTNNTSTTTKEQKTTTIKQDVKPTIATTSTKEQTKVVNTSTQKTTEQGKPISKEFPKTETTQQTKPEYPKQTTVTSTNIKPTTVEKIPVKSTTNIKTQSTVDTNIVQFCIQILSSSKRIKLDSSIFKGENKVRELKYAGAYKYLIGNELEYNNIVLLKNKVKINFPDAFIVSTKNGRRIPIAEALVIISKK